jgi:acyl-CoA synthetase (AMP-forming)/AMP-acid ligase II
VPIYSANLDGRRARFSQSFADISTVYWGCHWARGVVSPANPHTLQRSQLADSGAKVLVVHSSLIKVATAAVQNLGILKSNIWVVDPQPLNQDCSTLDLFLRLRQLGV